MCRPFTSSLASRPLFQPDDAMNMQHKASSSTLLPSSSLVSPPPSMAPLTLPALRPAPRECKMVHISEAILLPSISLDMDECEDELKMLRPRFSHPSDYDIMQSFD